ncbi:osmoprotectant ABC transporter substrate-binding protein [Paenibacillus doosanensis]|uniref:glycine betaine ABC transporter substrate-binding protein n=1 Tax=Paenibacillus doosanensis TaxID=1229154 RepID=UPI00217F448E|nr:glycine betaine ABC transporter substrate-binding protein [Paenibacillus doosanensis]MCS7460176.1 osmoprotectant ABC transporter substrate-binding protein [Paenibacillus doosanensis]
MKKIHFGIGLTVVALLSIILSGCGKTDVVIGTQTYTETKILAEMYKALIEDRTSLTAKVKPDLAASQVVIDGLKNNDIQMATLYTGEIFNNHFEVKPSHDRQEVLQQAKDGFHDKYNIKWFDPYGFENTYIFTVRKDIKEEKKLSKVSDVKPYAKDLKFGVDTTWLERADDGYPAFQKMYDMSFKDPHPMDINLVYSAVANKDVDIVLAYSTDPRIKQFDLVTLEDDKHFFPPYDACPVMNESLLKEHPELEEVAKALVGKINVDTIVALNYKVDVDQQTPKDVAIAFLKEQGLLQ